MPARTHEYKTDFRSALSSFTGRCSAGTAISRDGSRPPLPPLLPLVAGPLPSLPSKARTAADHRLRWGWTGCPRRGAVCCAGIPQLWCIGRARTPPSTACMLRPNVSARPLAELRQAHCSHDLIALCDNSNCRDVRMPSVCYRQQSTAREENVQQSDNSHTSATPQTKTL